MRRALLLACIGVLACGGKSNQSSGGDQGNRVPAKPPGYTNPIPAENALAGDPAWLSGREAYNHQIELYADRVSARAGDTVSVMASAASDGGRHHTATWALYRFGWYAGAGARKVAQGGPIPVVQQDACPMEAGTGLVRCAWTQSFAIHLDPSLVSGLYAVKLTRDDGFVRFAPLVVIDDRPADLVVEAPVDTYQAYNRWGGESLYYDASNTMPTQKAVKVSFDRPFASGFGLSDMLGFTAPFARFLEHYGYDASYTSNARLAADGVDRLKGVGAFVSAGHDEYWSGELRDAVESARDAGVSLLFFGANVAYWKTRYEAFAGDDNPRVIVCYKGRSQDDPVQGAGVTARYRDPIVNRPENGLAGVMYDGWLLLTFPFRVIDDQSWLFEGTGLRAGDTLPMLVGDEYDRTATGDYQLFKDYQPFQPAETKVLAQSPVLNAEGKPSVSETATYRASSGALVFATGMIAWPTGLDPSSPAYDSRIERMTANVLHAAIGVDVPSIADSSPQRPSPLGPFAASVTTFAAGFTAPAGIAVLPNSDVVVADAQGQQIFLAGAGGNHAVSLLAGDGQFSSNPRYDAVPGTSARFNFPTGVAVMQDGSIAVSDTGNHCIRRIGNDPAHTVTTLAGQMGAHGFADGAGNAARFTFPMGIAVDPRSGAILVADSGNNRIRSVDTSGKVTTIVGGAGPGDSDGPAAAAQITYPTAVAAAPDGRIFLVTSYPPKVKVIGTDAARTVTTIAGADDEGFVDGPGDQARLAPQGGAVWAGGQLLVADPGNDVIRAIVPGRTAASTFVHTFAGSMRAGADDGSGETATFGLPLGMAVGPDGAVYVADAANGSIRLLRE